MTHRITRESLRAAGACYPRAKLEALVPPEGLTPAEVAAQAHVPAWDRHWALSSASGATDAQLRLHAVWCARRALALVSEPDPRSIAACDVAEAYARGEASEEDLRVARDAAYAYAYAAYAYAYAAYAARAAYTAAAADARDSAADAAAYAAAAADARDSAAYADSAVFWEAAVADLAERLG